MNTPPLLHDLYQQRIENRLHIFHELLGSQGLGLSTLDHLLVIEWLGTHHHSAPKILARLDAVIAFPCLLAEALSECEHTSDIWSAIDAGKSVIEAFSRWANTPKWVLRRLGKADPSLFRHDWPESFHLATKWFSQLPPETATPDWSRFVHLVALLDEIYPHPCPGKALAELRHACNANDRFAGLIKRIGYLALSSNTAIPEAQLKQLQPNPADAMACTITSEHTAHGNSIWSIDRRIANLFRLNVNEALHQFTQAHGLDTRILHCVGRKIAAECLARAGLESTLAQLINWQALRQAFDKTPGPCNVRWPPVFRDSFRTNNLHVIELASTRALADEGAYMHHCVGSYSIMCCYFGKRVLSIRDSSGRSLCTGSLHLRRIEKENPTGFSIYVEQVRGPRNTIPDAASEAALSAYVAHLESAVGQAAIASAEQLREQQFPRNHFTQDLHVSAHHTPTLNLPALLGHSGISAQWLYARLSEEEISWTRALEQHANQWEKLAFNHDLDATDFYNDLLAQNQTGAWDDFSKTANRLGIEGFW